MSISVSIPAGFRYKTVFLKGRPVHDKHSTFYAIHPPMSPAKWAKIFSPFDALRGFNEAISSKETQYVSKRLLDDDAQSVLNRKLHVLKELTRTRRSVKINNVRATITYFAPCTDMNHEAYGYKGRYICKSGIVWNVDTDLTKAITLDDVVINLEDILDIHIESSCEEEYEVIA